MRIGLLTGGGDVPGLNSAIRAVVKHGEINLGLEIIGIRNGWIGAAKGDFFKLTRNDVRGIGDRGGTILGSSRHHPHEHKGEIQKIAAKLKAAKIDGLICIGGDGTLNAAAEVHKAGVPVIGIPKTIDNDVAGTEFSIGWNTATQIATEAIDRLHTTAESHNRVALIEVMGRNNGWIAINAGLAGGADFILAPERPTDVNELIAHIQNRHKKHATYSIVVVAEGAKLKKGSTFSYEDASGEVLSRFISKNIMKEIQFKTDFDCFLTVLGHVQRGGTPSSFDRILASRFGEAAIEAAANKKFGCVTTINSSRINLKPFASIAGKPNPVPRDLIRTAFDLS